MFGHTSALELPKLIVVCFATWIINQHLAAHIDFTAFLHLELCISFDLIDYQTNIGTGNEL